MLKLKEQLNVHYTFNLQPHHSQRFDKHGRVPNFGIVVNLIAREYYVIHKIADNCGQSNVTDFISRICIANYETFKYAEG